MPTDQRHILETLIAARQALNGVARFNPKGNIYHDDEGHFTGTGGHTGRKPKPPNKGRKPGEPTKQEAHKQERQKQLEEFRKSYKEAAKDTKKEHVGERKDLTKEQRKEWGDQKKEHANDRKEHRAFEKSDRKELIRDHKKAHRELVREQKAEVKHEQKSHERNVTKIDKAHDTESTKLETEQLAKTAKLAKAREQGHERPDLEERLIKQTEAKQARIDKRQERQRKDEQERHEEEMSQFSQYHARALDEAKSDRKFERDAKVEEHQDARKAMKAEQAEWRSDMRQEHKEQRQELRDQHKQEREELVQQLREELESEGFSRKSDKKPSLDSLPEDIRPEKLGSMEVDINQQNKEITNFLKKYPDAKVEDIDISDTLKDKVMGHLEKWRHHKDKQELDKLKSILAADKLPPVIVHHYGGGDVGIPDGFHRIAAYVLMGNKSIKGYQVGEVPQKRSINGKTYARSMDRHRERVRFQDRGIRETSIRTTENEAMVVERRFSPHRTHKASSAESIVRHCLRQRGWTRAFRTGELTDEQHLDLLDDARQYGRAWLYHEAESLFRHYGHTDGYERISGKSSVPIRNDDGSKNSGRIHEQRSVVVPGSDLRGGDWVDCLVCLEGVSRALGAAMARHVGRFFDRAKAFIRELTLAGAMILHGTDPLTADEIRDADQMVQVQVAYLDRFQGEVIVRPPTALSEPVPIGAGPEPMSQAQFTARAEQYGGVGWTDPLEINRRRMIRGGVYTEERRYHGLIKNDMCEVCDAAVIQGWSPVGSLPKIGSSPCGNQCHCFFKFRDRDGNEATTVRIMNRRRKVG